MSTRLVRTKGDKWFDAINTVLLTIILIIAIYPLYFSLIASISDPLATAVGRVIIYPVGLTFKAYQFVFENRIVWIGYRNSLIYMVAGTIFDLLLSIPAAYALSKKELPQKKLLTWFYLITMYFTGGMIPTYIVIKNLQLVNTPVVMILLGAVSIYNVVVARTYFSTSIPESLYEAAYVDGATELTSFFRIALPLSGPIIAVIGLYYAVGHWNGFFNALLYLSKEDYFPLQLILRNILLLNQKLNMGELLDDEHLQLVVERQRTAEAMKYALIFIASAPVIIGYCFAQKYFISGLMTGAVKG